MFTLQNFESQIDPTILKRGQNYFRQDRVQELSEIETDIWTALVEGTEVYQVRIDMDSNGKIETVCDCPYDMGMHCKHEVAVLYALNEHMQGGEDDFEPKVIHVKMKKSRKPKTEKKNRSIESILGDFTKEQLSEIILKALKTRCDLKNLILARSVAGEEQVSKSDYRRLIKQNIRAAYGRDGYLDYWGSGQAMANIEPIFAEARDALEIKQPQKAVTIAQALIEELVKTIGEADDSNGEIGGSIDEAFDLLMQAVGALSEPEQENLFEQCQKDAQNGKYGGWDFEWDFMSVASRICPKGRRDDFFAALDEMAKTKEMGYGSDYRAKRAAEMKWDCIEAEGNETEMEVFLKQHINLDSIRTTAIEYYLDKDNLNQAKTLVKEGIEKTKTEKPGLHNDYWEYLLQIAQEEKDAEEIKRITKKLLFLKGSFEYYDQLKSLYSAEEWKAFLESTITRLQKNPNHQLASIYQREEMWKELLDYVFHQGSIWTLNQYEKDLKAHYPLELAKLYGKFVYKEMDNYALNRKNYQTMCQYLRRMKKLGAKEEMQKIVDDLRENHPRRPALLEELEKV